MINIEYPTQSIIKRLPKLLYNPIFSINLLHQMSLNEIFSTYWTIAFTLVFQYTF
jgi:hypothetical protein